MPSASTPTMWRRRLLSALVLILGLATIVVVWVRVAGDDDPSTTATQPPATSPDLGEEVADATDESAPVASGGEAVLTEADLPAGWATRALAGADNDLCGDEDPFTEVAPARLRRASFERGPSGPFLTSIVADFRTPAQAGDFLEAVDEAIEACATYDDAVGEYRLRPVEAPDLGDEAMAARLTGNGLLGPVEGRLTYVRVGSRVATITSLARGTLDARVGDAALRVVVDRLS